MTQVPSWSVDELRSALERRLPVTVLDIRQPEERAEWWIPGSDHLPISPDLNRGMTAGLADALSRWDRSRPMVMVCAQGRTSLLATEALRRLGFEAYSLAGGMRAWSQAWNVAEVPLPAGGPRVTQVRRVGKGCLSYLIGSDGEAAVVDPSVEPGVYQELARERGLRITAALDTHVHADHVTRAYALAQATGARTWLPAQERVRGLPFEPLEDGQVVRVGAIGLRAVSSPGHTHESMCYTLPGLALFTGDTLFVRGVGRPDLKASGTEADQRARLLYRTLRDRIFGMQPNTQLVLPCHTGEPTPFDGVPHTATLAQAREAAGLDGLSEDEFVREVLARIPPDPPNHVAIVRINEGLEAAPEDLAALEAGANRCAISQAQPS